MNRRNALASVAAGALTAGLGGVLAACTENKPQFKAVDLTGADYAKDFRGKLVVMFFGYTQCPDVCPTTLSDLAEAKKLMGPNGAKVQGLFVTVDPERDTPQVLKGYMANFDPTFLALRGTPEQLAAVAKDFKVYYKRVDGKTPTSYTMDHSAANFVYDTQGHLRLYSRYDAGPQALASDLQLLLKDEG
jgi:protein SCO1/2